jgi:hypothetical protein
MADIKDILGIQRGNSDVDAKREPKAKVHTDGDAVNPGGLLSVHTRQPQCSCQTADGGSVSSGTAYQQHSPVMTLCDAHPGQEPKAQRPAGMSREAFALLGDSHPIAPSELANELKKPGDAQVGQLLIDHRVHADQCGMHWRLNAHAWQCDASSLQHV